MRGGSSTERSPATSSFPPSARVCRLFGNAKADAEPSRGSSCCEVGTITNSRPGLFFVDRGRYLFPFAAAMIDVPANDARPSALINANRPGSCSMRSRLQKFGHDIDSVGRRARGEKAASEKQGGIAMGKTGKESTEKAGVFPFSSPFPAKIPLFSPAMQGPATRSGKRLALRRRAVLRSQHTI